MNCGKEKFNEDIKRFYSDYRDDMQAKRYYSKYPLRNFVHTSRINCLLSHLKEGTSMLEIGCGDGVFAVEAAKNGFSVTATDISQSNLDAAKVSAEKAGVADKILFFQADAENLPFSDGQFDMVVASHILEHLPKFKEGLSEVRRVSKKNALIALPTVLNLCSLVIIGGGRWWYFSKRGPLALIRGFLRVIFAMLAFKNGVEEGFYGQKNMPHLWRFPWAMKKEIKKAGFKIKIFEPDSLPFPFFNIFLPIIRFLDRHRHNILIRNFGYGSHVLIEKD